MPAFNDFVIFADESGDHSLTSINPQYPVFVLAVCLFGRRSYEIQTVRWVDRLKEKHFGRTDVILHERDIRQAAGPFKVLVNAAARDSFCADVDKLISYSRFTLFASVVKKPEHVAKYSSPDNPYHLSVGFCLERLTMHLRRQGCRTGRGVVVFERRGAREDAELELEFRRVCDGDNRLRERLPFDIRFETKRMNSAGLQFADLLARPIGRYVLDPTQPNRAYSILEPKFDRSHRGKVDGWGRKIFP